MKCSRFTVLVGLLFLPLGVGAQSPMAQGQLYGDFWAPLQSIRLGELQPPPIDETTLTQELLEESRMVFSGMIYGYKVLYRPSDTRRNQGEVLDVTTLHLIPWGDPGLRFVDNRLVRETGRIYGRFRYLLKPQEIRRMEGWHGAGLPQSGAWGEVVATLPFESRKGALDEALKESLRNYLRSRVYEKPQEIQAEMVLKKQPYYLFEGGRVRCRVEVILRILQVRHYEVY